MRRERERGAAGPGGSVGYKLSRLILLVLNVVLFCLAIAAFALGTKQSTYSDLLRKIYAQG